MAAAQSLEGAVRRGRRRGGRAARPGASTRRRPLPDAVGMLYDSTRCIGCKACVVACREANGTPPEPKRRRARHADGARTATPRTSSSSTRTTDRRRLRVREGAVHALRRPVLRVGVHDRRAQEDGERDRSPTTRAAASAAATARWPARSTSRSSSGSRPRRRSSSASCAATGLAEGKLPACVEVCPRQAVIYGKRDGAARRRRTARLEANPRFYQPKVYGETDGGGTQVLYLSRGAVRASWACPSRATAPAPRSPRRSSTASTRASSRRPCSTSALAAVVIAQPEEVSGDRRRRERMSAALRSAGPSSPAASIRSSRSRGIAVLAILAWRFSSASAPPPGSTTAIRGASGSPSTWSPAPPSPAAATRWRCWSTSSTGASTTRWSGRRSSPPRSATRMAGLSVSSTSGRYWNAWKLAAALEAGTSPRSLLEVALCIMTYMVVLWIELSPALLEKWKQAATLAAHGHDRAAAVDPSLRPGAAVHDRARHAAADDAPVARSARCSWCADQAAPALAHAACCRSCSSSASSAWASRRWCSRRTLATIALQLQAGDGSCSGRWRSLVSIMVLHLPARSASARWRGRLGLGFGMNGLSRPLPRRDGALRDAGDPAARREEARQPGAGIFFAARAAAARRRALPLRRLPGRLRPGRRAGTTSRRCRRCWSPSASSRSRCAAYILIVKTFPILAGWRPTARSAA